MHIDLIMSIYLVRARHEGHKPNFFYFDVVDYRHTELYYVAKK